MLLVLVLFLSPYALTEIPQAIPAAEATKLKAAGVVTTDDLLAKGAAARSRKELAKSTGVDEKKLKDYVEMADLLRIAGVGPEMVRLFAAAKVHNTKDLAKQDPKKFFDAIMSANDKQKITQNPPDPKSVAAWIDKAKALPQVLK
jgi:DNA polymerase/3'-5' exonuclease PolX